MGSRVVKVDRPKEHTLQIKTDQGSYLNVVRGGKRRAYLWVGGAMDGTYPSNITVSGEKSLRALAYAILDEVGDA